MVELEFRHVESVPLLNEGHLVDIQRLIIEYNDALEDSVPGSHLPRVLSLLYKHQDASFLKLKS
jgi:hypothetical protein